MTQEDKELLLKDLCARLPYGIIVHTDCGDMALDRNHRGIGVLYYEHYNEEAKKRCGYDETDFSIILSGCYYGDIKPYLRPMSSIASLVSAKEWSILGGIELIDWYNANHIDYRGLIEKGLALEAPKGMY